MSLHHKVLDGGIRVEREHRVKVTSKGQITIPVDVRRNLGLNQGDVLIIRDSGAGYMLEKAATRSKFDEFVGCLVKDAPVSTDDVMRDIRGDRRSD